MRPVLSKHTVLILSDIIMNGLGSNKNDIEASQVNCLHSDFHLANFIKQSLMGMLAFLGEGESITLDGRILTGIRCLGVPHLEAQAKFHTASLKTMSPVDEAKNEKHLNPFPWPMLCSMRPEERRAALRMQLMICLLCHLPDMVPSGFNDDKLPRLAAIASDVIMNNIYAQQNQDDHLSMAEQTLFCIMEDQEAVFMAVIRGSFDAAGLSFRRDQTPPEARLPLAPHPQRLLVFAAR